MKLISKERKVSEVVGTGIQYLPGHQEKFVDFVVETYAVNCNKIVDLGGGGFRFAFPLALGGKQVSVVDMDPLALDAETIKRHVAQKSPAFSAVDTSLISTCQEDALVFLGQTTDQWDFISAFRLLHFFTPEQIKEFFVKASKAVAAKGLLVISGISEVETDAPSVHNEIYLQSDPISPDGLHRRFKNVPAAQDIRTAQNLQEHIHLFSKEMIGKLAAEHGFSVIVNDFPSTKIVYGYVLQKD